MADGKKLLRKAMKLANTFPARNLDILLEIATKDRITRTGKHSKHRDVMIRIGDGQLRIREGGTHKDSTIKATGISQIVLNVVIVGNGDMRRGDPVMPQGILEQESRAWYNVDDYKEEISVFVNKIYDRCALHIEEGRDEMEKYHKKSRIKPLKEGDRVYVKYIPKRGMKKKLQPLYDGPYRVLRKISDVVVKLRKIVSSKEVTVHTDKIRLIPEASLTNKEDTEIRRAYPVRKYREEAEEPWEMFAYDEDNEDDMIGNNDNEQPDEEDEVEIVSPPRFVVSSESPVCYRHKNPLFALDSVSLRRAKYY
ncbi:hypothetical protein Pcinc_000824 [Petrolisthes cinctipes]|uniref:Uncharacterized protein n=1 Tax=Petrolisthes cinctipes TaxID=88211 RepID=A0AAE1GMY5_PETCI|nr:hypothetical protein Pcinc_000824 [Petrolisthes cinctipes]